MSECQLRKVSKSPLFEIKIYQNRPSLDILDDSIIPDHYWRKTEKVEVSIDKELVKKDIANGVRVPGCALVTKPRVDIK